RRGFPEAGAADVDVEEALLGVVAGAAAVEVADAMPEAREVGAGEGEVGGKALGVEGAAGHRPALRLQVLVVVGAPVAGEDDEGRGQHYRMKARTWHARASVMRMRAIGMSPGGSRSGGNHSQASDSGPQASAPPVIRHSNDELT